MPTDELNKWELESRNSAIKIMDDFGDLVNGGRNRLPLFLLEGFKAQHRTLQQGIVRAFVEMLLEWRKGEQSYNVDLRNQASWDFAKSLDEMTHFPFI